MKFDTRPPTNRRFAGNTPARQSGSPVISADMIEKAQFASSQKKKGKKKKATTSRSAWGG